MPSIGWWLLRLSCSMLVQQTSDRLVRPLTCEGRPDHPWAVGPSWRDPPTPPPNEHSRFPGNGSGNELGAISDDTALTEGPSVTSDAGRRAARNYPGYF